MFRLLIPALIPSWRFFDAIAPAPRIEFALMSDAEDAVSAWQEFRPRPAQLSWPALLRRMFWNPRWNESLYLASCAERLLEQPGAAFENELLSRVGRGILADGARRDVSPAEYFCVRVIVVKRDRGQISREVMFTSLPRRLDRSSN